MESKPEIELSINQLEQEHQEEPQISFLVMKGYYTLKFLGEFMTDLIDDDPRLTKMPIKRQTHIYVPKQSERAKISIKLQDKKYIRENSKNKAIKYRTNTWNQLNTRNSHILQDMAEMENGRELHILQLMYVTQDKNWIYIQETMENWYTQVNSIGDVTQQIQIDPDYETTKAFSDTRFLLILSYLTICYCQSDADFEFYEMQWYIHKKSKAEKAKIDLDENTSLIQDMINIKQHVRTVLLNEDIRMNYQTDALFKQCALAIQLVEENIKRLQDKLDNSEYQSFTHTSNKLALQTIEKANQNKNQHPKS